ncbi:CRISPR-associated endonuclease Cas3'' [Chromobacterium sp. IIBBL 290-4]|uniref:CRISPR-associated endonuclease Cas3'' n=1 Tax=Chromobacterium sp. IIBBL 290-4 TaxID=2953890 RepID=UPI0020B72671|nr:CRISPR-associated endonuclease Cas3'' [Chromobacterium sp. IIBBL 290-4]UTH74269.1 CRISPR-associated endonuclease Cas3'' [Chromobacterium sp. IIBBL 290-4]
MTRFFAHTGNAVDKSDWQTLMEHLGNVGELAGAFARIFGAEAMGQAGGRLHDLGKYTDRFQQRLCGGPPVDHASWGAVVACRKYQSLGHLLAYGIAGHHAGLANGEERGERSPLRERMASELPALDPQWQQEIALPDTLPPPEGFRPDRARGGFQQAFLARMVFSCVVDGDFLDTEAYYRRLDPPQRPSRGSAVSLFQLKGKLDQHLAGLPTEGEVNSLRGEILHAARGKAGLSQGLFSLTVPTGGGKTLASLAFALDHALAHGLRRVIYVIPFTSVVEQTAAVFRQAFGDLGEQAVLEHHSAFVDDPGQAREARDKLALAMENWDWPVVVTTSVQFFESLFASRPSRCRKLHNIAGSVVILDEAQALPLAQLRPCVAALDELARNYRTSVVLCTATQPALSECDFAGGFAQVEELAPDPARLFRALERVTVRHIGEEDDAALAARFAASPQALCIVNSRRHARELYQAIRHLSGARHLTTLMCARHRTQVLAEIKTDLREGRPVRLVATSLIEAGVDIDFPAVWRAEAGLDAVAQAAGRCNREGRRAAKDSEVLIFRSPCWPPPPELRQAAQAAAETLRRHQGSPLGQAAIHGYFTQLYWDKGERALDKNGLLALLSASRIHNLPMERLDRDFRMIESALQPVIVPFDEVARRALADLAYAESCGQLARALQPYLVQIPRRAFDALRAAGAIQPVNPCRFGDQFMQLLNPALYDAEHGLSWDDPTFVEAEKNVW